MLTKSEIHDILQSHLSIGQWPRTRVAGMTNAAEALTAHLTPAHLMSHFVQPLGTDDEYEYLVYDQNGLFYQVRLQLDGAILCWAKHNGASCYDSSKHDKPCHHVEAVKLHLAKRER